VPADGVPPCGICHGPAEAARNPVFPRLAGQDATYIATQLRLFQSGRRGGTKFAPVMEAIAQRLSEEQIAQVAAYFASLPPMSGEGRRVAAD
jgi:cytochrome c553